MATSKPAKFEPHHYATALIKDDWRSDRSMLYHWTGTHWSVTSDFKVSEASAYAWLVHNQLAHVTPENAKRAVNAALLHLPPLAETVTVGVVVPCANGYVHLSSTAGSAPKLLPADKELNIRHVLTVSYDEAATSAPNFDRFIERALPFVDVRARVQEYIGYTLLADARFQKAQLWLGEGANGKGVLVNLVQKLHGCVAAVFLDSLSGFELAPLVGASLVYCDEAPRGKFNEQLVKSVIAGEKVPVRRHYLPTASLRLQGKWIVMGNHVPTVTDHSAGFWRRWDLVPFGSTVPERERDPLLLEKILLNEMPAILNWALAGLQRLLTRGGFEPELPAPMSALLNSARVSSNSTQAWIQDCGLRLTPGGITSTRKTRLYAHYRDWCLANGLQAFSSMKWFQFIETLYPNRVILKRQRLGGEPNPDWYVNLTLEDSSYSLPSQI